MRYYGVCLCAHMGPDNDTSHHACRDLFRQRALANPAADPTVAATESTNALRAQLRRPQQAGMPTPAADGTMSVRGQRPRRSHDLRLRGDGLHGQRDESGLSNEMPTGYAQVAPLMDSDGDGLTDAAEDLKPQPDRRSRRDGSNNRDTGRRRRSRWTGTSVQGTAPGTAVNASGCSCAQITCNNGMPVTGLKRARQAFATRGPAQLQRRQRLHHRQLQTRAPAAFIPISGCTACTTAASATTGTPAPPTCAPPAAVSRPP